MNELIKKLRDLKEKEKEIKYERECVEVEIFNALSEKLKPTGQTNFEFDDDKISIKRNWSVSVDQELAKERPDLFKVKYEMTLSQYEKSPEKITLDRFITIKENKPTFVLGDL